MFDIGFWEIVLILVLALVVIGPERLPGAARQAGHLIGRLRRYIEGVRSEVESEIDVAEFKRLLHNQEVQINELQQQIRSGMDDIKRDLPDTDKVTQSDIMTDVPSHSFYDESTIADSAGEVTEKAAEKAGEPKAKNSATPGPDKS